MPPQLGSGNITLQSAYNPPSSNDSTFSLGNIINVTSTEAYSYLNNPLNEQDSSIYLMILNDPCFCKTQIDQNTGLPLKPPHTPFTENEIIYQCNI